MADKDEGNIWRPKWKCKSCGPGGGGGGDGDPEMWRALLFLALVLIPAVAFGGYLWFSARGVDVGERSCAWDGEQGRYVANIQLRNSEPSFKIVSLRVQGHFRPGPGQRWPDQSLQVHYSDISEWLTVEIAPESSTDVVAQFPLPGVEQFDCSAEAWVVGQRRFDERPSPETLQTIKGAV